jgi:hypothetical protein
MAVCDTSDDCGARPHGHATTARTTIPCPNAEQASVPRICRTLADTLLNQSRRLLVWRESLEECRVRRGHMLLQVFGDLLAFLCEAQQAQSIVMDVALAPHPSIAPLRSEIVVCPPHDTVWPSHWAVEFVAPLFRAKLG